MDILIKCIGINNAHRCIEGNTLIEYKNTIFNLLGFCGGPEGWGLNYLQSHIPKDICTTRGFCNNGSMYDLNNYTYTHIPSIDIKPRQNSSYVLIDDVVYILGGFSYVPLTKQELESYNILPSKKGIYTYNDGICCKLGDNSFSQLNKLSLPIPITDFGIHYHKTHKKIYIITGCVYDGCSFNCRKNLQNYDNIPIGRIFLRFSIDKDRKLIEDNISLCKFPGTPRFMSMTFLRNDHIYVLGGVDTTENINNSKGYNEYEYSNVLDNWKYSIEKDEWIRLQNYPLAMSCQGFVIYKNRYAIIIGGVSYNKSTILNNLVDTSKIAIENKRFPYNNISSCPLFEYQRNMQHLSSQYNKYCSNMIVIYDIEKDIYKPSDVSMPLNMSSPKAVIKDDIVYIMGGEGNPQLLNGNFFSIHFGGIIQLKIIMKEKKEDTDECLSNKHENNSLVDSYEYALSVLNNNKNIHIPYLIYNYAGIKIKQFKSGNIDIFIENVLQHKFVKNQFLNNKILEQKNKYLTCNLFIPEHKYRFVCTHSFMFTTIKAALLIQRVWRRYRSKHYLRRLILQKRERDKSMRYISHLKEQLSKQKKPQKKQMKFF